MGAQTTYSDAPTGKGFSGMPGTPDRNEYVTLKNVEASASIQMGRAVKLDLSAPESDYSALLPAAEADIIFGIVAFSQSYARAWTDSDGVVHGNLSSTGILPGAFMAVATRGRLLVQCDSGCLPGDHLWVRAVAGGGENLGACENADDSTDMCDCTNAGQWLTTAAADGLAWLTFDFTGDLT